MHPSCPLLAVAVRFLFYSCLVDEGRRYIGSCIICDGGRGTGEGRGGRGGACINFLCRAWSFYFCFAWSVKMFVLPYIRGQLCVVGQEAGGVCLMYLCVPLVFLLCMILTTFIPTWHSGAAGLDYV